MSGGRHLWARGSRPEEPRYDLLKQTGWVQTRQEGESYDLQLLVYPKDSGTSTIWTCFREQ